MQCACDYPLNDKEVTTPCYEAITLVGDGQGGVSGRRMVLTVGVVDGIEKLAAVGISLPENPKDIWVRPFYAGQFRYFAIVGRRNHSFTQLWSLLKPISANLPPIKSISSTQFAATFPNSFVPTSKVHALPETIARPVLVEEEFWDWRAAIAVHRIA